MNIVSKLPHVGTTIFTTMSALAVEHSALNLGQGFPSFPVDPVWGDLVKKYIDKGFNQYAPMPGVPELRQAIAVKIQHTYHQSAEANTEITVTAGATQAIFTAINALVHPGDEVILFAPAYDCYAPAVELAGGVVKWVELTFPEYQIPWDIVKNTISEKTRMILINHPHNPTGASISKSDIIALEDLVRGTNIIVLSDEVYEHILFDGREHHSVWKSDELRERSIAVYSFGKTFHLTGWKMGYVVARPHLMAEFRKVHQYNVFSCNTPMQYALAEYLSTPSHYEVLPSFYQEKRDLFLGKINNPLIKVLPCAGTYFALLDYSAMNQNDDVAEAIRWTKEYKLTTIPCSVFYPNKTDNKVLRVCFAKDESTLQLGADVISGIG